MSKCRYDLSEDCNNTDCLNCVLDEIKTEIRKHNIADFIAVQSVLEIIDKYKAESEDKEC